MFQYYLYVVLDCVKLKMDFRLIFSAAKNKVSAKGKVLVPMGLSIALPGGIEWLKW